jgi:hypothetical protein
MAKIRTSSSRKPVAKAKVATGSRKVVPPSTPTLDSFMEKSMNGPSLEFNVSDIESKPSRSGTVGFRVTTLGGVAISWWSSYKDGTTWRDLIEDAGHGVARVKPGVRVAQDGGLIPASAPVSKGFWE